MPSSHHPQLTVRCNASLGPRLTPTFFLSFTPLTETGHVNHVFTISIPSLFPLHSHIRAIEPSVSFVPDLSLLQPPFFVTTVMGSVNRDVCVICFVPSEVPSHWILHWEPISLRCPPLILPSPLKAHRPLLATGHYSLTPQSSSEYTGSYKPLTSGRPSACSASCSSP